MTECLSTSLVTHKEESFSLFRLLFVWSCFRLVTACSSFLWLASGCSTFDNDVTEYFDLIINHNKSISCRFYYMGQALLQSWEAFRYCITKQEKFYYKMGQLFCIAKQGKLYYKIGQVLQSEATFVTKGDNYHKVQKTHERKAGEQQIPVTDSLIPP